MHLRGKDMRMTATLPDGTTKTLLNVPAYDFNWQLFYYPKERVALPRGTRVDVVAHYDNSADNKHNPDPDRAVTFGEQSTDEMMFGVFEFTPAEGVSPTPVTGQTRMEALQTTLPAETSYRVMVNVLPGRPPFASILHLPKQGQGTWYIAQGALQINVVPIKQINWNGDAFDFRMDIRFGANAAFTFDAKGAVGGDGSVHADITPVGVERAPFSRAIDGSRLAWK
jgi:hypothetical protein